MKLSAAIAEIVHKYPTYAEKRKSGYIRYKYGFKERLTADQKKLLRELLEPFFEIGIITECTVYKDLPNMYSIEVPRLIIKSLVPLKNINVNVIKTK